MTSLPYIIHGLHRYNYKHDQTEVKWTQVLCWHIDIYTSYQGAALTYTHGSRLCPVRSLPVAVIANGVRPSL